ncbi:FtsB family cell division protein [Arthrobacter sp. PsM3]|uniref:FtsB family cell division protein n=1 Tax=Arthrobacter sp. PsM3 TaxID=3030531 RepID=UPI00263AD302|nr:septum formation initiator family protein [Arthrobacter sp. PsM3]MDN4644664.1 septum formation initiator family protein [Arthrobacter sp. PsM3]
MATRRPKVPRATPAAPKAPDTNDGGDVIQADFGVSREAHPHASGSARTAGPHTGGSPRQAAAPSAAARQNAATAGPGKSGTATTPRAAKSGTAPGAAKSGAGTPGTATPGTAKSGAAKPGAAKPGTAKPGTAKPGTAKQSKDGSAQAGEHLGPVPAKAFSGRMLALFVVMIAITIMLAPTVKIFFEKRAEIAALQADISAKKSQQSDLRLQVSRWQDPNYVKQQARDRINMVMPGETGYWVFGSDLPAGASSGAAGAGSAQDPAELPWVDSLWDSVRRSATD